MVPSVVKRILIDERDDFLFFINLSEEIHVSYEKDGRFWPTEHGMQARGTIYWVHSSEIGSNELVLCQVRENEQDIENRNRCDFPIYRIVKWGQELLRIGVRVDGV